jgi:hypothetical protein
MAKFDIFTISVSAAELLILRHSQLLSEEAAIRSQERFAVRTADSGSLFTVVNITNAC